MLKTGVALSVAMAAWASLSAPAFSADLDRTLLRAPELPMTRPVEVGSGWYLRGDVGYSLDTSNDGPDFRVYQGTSDYGAGQFRDDSIDSDWSGTLGFGYHFTDWLRADLTAEYMKGDFGDRLGGPCAAENPVGECALDQDFEAWGFMANAYVDLGTYAGFTPYVGGGAGVMSVNWDNLHGRCVNSIACNGTELSAKGEHSWRFAYQLSAGLAYAITKNLKLDVGYRYFNADGGKMADFNPGDQGLGATGVQTHDDGFSKSEIRAGLRYDIW